MKKTRVEKKVQIARNININELINIILVKDLVRHSDRQSRNIPKDHTPAIVKQTASINITPITFRHPSNLRVSNATKTSVSNTAEEMRMIFMFILYYHITSQTETWRGFDHLIVLTHHL